MQSVYLCGGGLVASDHVAGNTLAVQRTHHMRCFGAHGVRHTYSSSKRY